MHILIGAEIMANIEIDHERVGDMRGLGNGGTERHGTGLSRGGLCVLIAAQAGANATAVGIARTICREQRLILRASFSLVSADDASQSWPSAAK